MVSSNGIAPNSNGSVSEAESDDSDVICLDDEPQSVQQPLKSSDQWVLLLTISPTTTEE